MRTAILTISDTRTEDNDISGDTLELIAAEAGLQVIERRIIKDDRIYISKALKWLADDGNTDLIMTTGGTGFAPSDITPEATLDVIDRETPGLAELMRSKTAKDTPASYLSRAVCGIRRQTLIINFPGSPKAVKECFDAVEPLLGHALNLLKGNLEHEK